MNLGRGFLLACAILLAPLFLAVSEVRASSAEPADRLERRSWAVGGVDRVALIALPKPDDVPAEGAPLIFVFHGHGGSARKAAGSFDLHDAWPEAIVVYPEGLPTPGRLTDPEGKQRGWQNRAGDQGDRDLRFFDTMLTCLRTDQKVDSTRIYATGHSNGGGFTYLLWQHRHAVLAAVAPSAAGIRSAAELKPLPAMHLAGKADKLVRFEAQERVMAAIQRVNGCAKDGKPWGVHATIYESPTATPVVTYIHDGGHAFPRDAVPEMVRFLRAQRQTPAPTPSAPPPADAAKPHSDAPTG